MFDHHLVAFYRERFVNRPEWYRAWVNKDGKCCYSYESAEKDDKNGRYPFRPVDDSLILDHFAGHITASWPAITADGRGKWICFDDDTDDIRRLDKLAETCTAYGWHPLLESRRSGRSGHLWLLFDGLAQADDLMMLAQSLAKGAGITSDAPHFEMFPKSSSKVSTMRGPLGVHLKTGQPGLFNDCQEKGIQAQLEWLQAQPLNSSSALAELSPELTRRRDAARKLMPPLIVTPRTRGGMAANFLEVVRQAGFEPKQLGKELATVCPLCRAEGHDKSGNNLRLSPDGRHLSCVYGGPGAIHKGADILKALCSR